MTRTIIFHHIIYFYHRLSRELYNLSNMSCGTSCSDQLQPKHDHFDFLQETHQGTATPSPIKRNILEHLMHN